MIWSNVKAWLAAAGVVIVAFVGALLYRAGRKAEEQRQLEARVRGAQDRARADADAAAAADPVDELRKRGWMRDVEADLRQLRGSDDRRDR